mmetsp:Transcript_21011/g.41936  ORF Transcript_21011/g.41936 Transcript_21011/m.41936 type:complete len:140 (-) Transcript_21011:680-1099(-)
MVIRSDAVFAQSDSAYPLKGKTLLTDHLYLFLIKSSKFPFAHTNHPISSITIISSSPPTLTNLSLTKLLQKSPQHPPPLRSILRPNNQRHQNNHQHPHHQRDQNNRHLNILTSHLLLQILTLLLKHIRLFIQLIGSFGK